MIFLWQIVSALISSQILLPTPVSVLKRFIDMISGISYWIAVWNTVSRGIIALLISIPVGIFLGLFMGFNHSVKMFFMPYIKLFQAIPPVSWIILAIIWLDFDVVPIFVMCIGLLPIMVINTMEGIEEIDPKIIEMANLYKLSKKSKLKIYIGSILPYIISGITIILGQTWKLSSIAEVLSNPRFGIGTELKWSLANIEVLDTFVWTLSIILISAFFNFTLNIFRKRIEKWKKKENF